MVSWLGVKGASSKGLWQKEGERGFTNKWNTWLNKKTLHSLGKASENYRRKICLQITVFNYALHSVTAFLDLWLWHTLSELNKSPNGYALLRNVVVINKDGKTLQWKFISSTNYLNVLQIKLTLDLNLLISCLHELTCCFVSSKDK